MYLCHAVDFLNIFAMLYYCVLQGSSGSVGPRGRKGDRGLKVMCRI